MDLSRGATGSVLAAVGTALPETSIPILALIAGNREGMDVAVGAIAGAPFMLATLAMCVTGAAVFYYHKKGRHEKNPEVRHGREGEGFGLLHRGLFGRRAWRRSSRTA